MDDSIFMISLKVESSDLGEWKMNDIIEMAPIKSTLIAKIILMNNPSFRENIRCILSVIPNIKISLEIIFTMDTNIDTQNMILFVS